MIGGPGYLLLHLIDDHITYMRKPILLIFYMHETYGYLKNILFSSDVKFLSATKHCISLDAIDANIQVPNKYYARGTFLYMSKFLHCTKKK